MSATPMGASVSQAQVGGLVDARSGGRFRTGADAVVVEVLRLLHGGSVHQMMSLDLLSLDQRVVSRHQRDFSRLNPGFTMSASTT